MHIRWQLSLRCTQHQLPISVSLDQFSQTRLISTRPEVFQGEIDDSPAQQHCLIIELKHKLSEHTVISESGQILEDRMIEILGFELDGIDVTQLLHKNSRYNHNHNGTSQSVQCQLDQYMGWNGLAKLEFTSPIWRWILSKL